MVDTVQPTRLTPFPKPPALSKPKEELADMEQHNPGLDTKQASSMVRGLDVTENIRASGAGRKMSLDIPFYRTF